MRSGKQPSGSSVQAHFCSECAWVVLKGGRAAAKGETGAGSGTGSAAYVTKGSDVDQAKLSS